MTRRRGATVLALTTALLLIGIAPVQAAQPAPPSPLDQCVAAALGAQHEQWVCLGGTLNYLARPAPTDNGGRAAASVDSEWVTQRIAPDTTQRTATESGGVTPMGNGDSWDTWCETGTVCSRTITKNYTDETKGNVAYGNRDGVVGTFDLILRTSLSGRTPRYSVGINQDTGPNLTVNTTINCVHDKLFDGTCGHYPVGSVYVGNYRSGLIYGNPIGKYSGTFFSTLTGVFTPDGAPLLKMPTLQTRKFTCPTTGNCKFPVFTT